MKRFVLIVFFIFPFIQLKANTYYSQGSLNPQLFTSWGTLVVGGTTPGSFTSAGDIFIIQNGHTMTTTGTWTIGSATSTLQILNGGILQGNTLIRLTGTFQIDNGGTYVHNNSATTSDAVNQSIFSGTENFAPGSNFEIRNWPLTLPPLPVISNPWGNLIINIQVDLGGIWEWQVGTGTILTINGNLDIRSTYSGTARELRLTGDGIQQINIGGDLLLSGTTTQVNMKNDNMPVSGYTTMQVTGNITLSNSAQLTLGINFANTASDVELYQLRFKGNFSAVATNTIAANSGIVQLVANGIVSQSLSCLATMDCNFKIASGSTVDLSSSLTYGIGNRVLGVLGTLNQNGYSMTINGTLETAGGTFNANGSFTVTSDCRACSGNGAYNTANSTWCALSGAKGTVNFSSSTITLANSTTQSFLTAGSFFVNSPGDIYFVNSTATSNSLANPANYIVEPNSVFSLDGSSYIAGANARYIGSGGTLRIGSADGITIAGNTTNGNVRTEAGKDYDFSGINSFEYFGASTQVAGLGLPNPIDGKLEINNSAGLGTSGVTLSQFTLVTGELALTNGKLTTANTTEIDLASGGILTTLYTDLSWVNGPMYKTGNTSFIFPIGKGNTIHPAGVVIVSGGNGGDHIKAEYFNSGPSCSPNIPTGGIHHISGLEYWALNRASMTASVTKITLYATTYSQATDRSKLVIARCVTATGWTNLGNEDLVTTGFSGPVTSSLTLSGGFPTSLFTLASIDPYPTNPLPINLISFDAIKLNDTKSSINWELTAFCSATAKFEIQRASTDKNFSKIAVVNGSETNKLYNYVDNDLKNGINYYRLKMIDEDGKIIYSRTAAVMNGVNGLLLTSLIPTMVTNSAVLTIASSRQQKMDLIITDMQGRIVQKQNHTIGAGNTNIQLSTDRLAVGVYQLTGITSEGKTNVIRFIKQ